MNERMFNRLLLSYLNDVRGIPQTFEELSSYAAGRVRRPCEAEAERALEYLVAAGYAERCELTAADPRMWKISATGIRMALKQVPAEELDPMVWGA